MPSVLTTLVLLVSGFCLFTAVHFLAVFFMMGRRYRERLAFGLMTLLGSGFAFSMAFQLNATDVEAYRKALLLYIGLFIPTFLVFLWFTAYYTGFRRRRFLYVMTIVNLLLWGLHWMRPYGLIADGLRDFGVQRLFGSQTVAQVRIVPSVWVVPFYLFLFVGITYGLRAGLAYVRANRWRKGKGYLASVVVSFFVGGHNFLVDLGRSTGPYVSEAAVLAFILFMTLALAAEWRDQDLLYGEIFDAQNDAILIHDPETCDVFQVNEAALRMFGATQRGQLLGSGAFRLAGSPPEQAAARMREVLHNCIADGPQTMDGMARRLDQTPFWVEISLRAATLSRRPCVIAVVRDVTEKRRVRESLREGERRFASVVEASPLGMQFFRLEPDDRFVLVAANSAADRLLRTSHQALVGKTLEEAFPELTGTDTAIRFRAAAREGRGWSTERVVTAPGFADTICEVLVVQAEPRSMLAMFLDVTERRRMEQERRRDETRLQEAQRLESLGMLAGGVAHDFNNILMAIQGNIELLEEEEGQTPDEVFDNVHTAIRRASDLCRQLLAYAGKSRLTVETLDLGALVHEVARIVEAGVTKKARWEYVVASDLPAVRGDATQLRQVILNLLTNAAESLGADGGRVCVTLETVSSPNGAALATGPHLRLVVEDEGCGMGPDTQARIFEPFFTTKVTGRGLGLAAVGGILRAHGGSIQVESSLGKGTRMVVLLPASAGQPEPVTRRSPPATFRGRALVVDDEEPVRRVTRRLLELLGLEVVEATCGKDAIARFCKEPATWTGVILDYTMPDLDGLETYRRIHAIRPDVLGLIASGYGLDDVTAAIAKFPRLGIIHKPYVRADLVSALHGLGWPNMLM